MRDRSDRYRVHTVELSSSIRKRLGSYLVESGLLTAAQLDVALNDQRITEQSTGTRMQLGEIVAARGWIKEQTIEYLMQKVVIPERREVERKLYGTTSQDDTVQQKRPQQVAKRPPTQPSKSGASPENPQVNRPGQAFARRDIPIAKPLPPVKSSTDDVNWVG
jgi:hypothetical protein